jgi:hypothetical protein
LGFRGPDQIYTHARACDKVCYEIVNRLIIRNQFLKGGEANISEITCLL